MPELTTNMQSPSGKPSSNKGNSSDFYSKLYNIVEYIGMMTIVVFIFLSFIAKISIVDGQSMEQTLFHQDRVILWEFMYEPKAGDIVVLQDISAAPYDRVIVKRVIATGGQTVDIDFSTWTLTVDGEAVPESYRYLDNSPLLTAEYSFPITLAENEVFILGDNRNHSADSRQIEIGPVDKSCIAGKVIARIFPFDRIRIFD